MARFDVYASPDGAGYVVDIQADLLDMLQTRIVVPLLAIADAPLQAKRLNPVFDIDGAPHVLVTQYMAAVPRSVLRAVVADLGDEAAQITDAVDFLMQGF
jgi:toxin CcdB